MRRIAPRWIVCFFGLLSATSPACADDHAARQFAAYELAMVQLQAYQYQFVDYPQAVRELDRQATFAQAALAAQQRRVDDYAPFRTFGRYAATRNAEEIDRLRLLASAQHVTRLQDEQQLLWLRHLAQLEQLEWQFKMAAARDRAAVRAHSAPK